MTPPLPDLVLYGRQGCHLCDEARRFIHLLLADRAARGVPVPTVQEVDIEADEALHRQFAFTIPVVRLGDRELELVTSMAKLRRLLADVLDGPGEAAP